MGTEKFETALKKLERIVEQLESGDLSLEETLKAYEDGVKLAGGCSAILNKAEKKIEVLSQRANGAFETEVFEEMEETKTPRGKGQKKKKKQAEHMRTDESDLF